MGVEVRDQDGVSAGRVTDVRFEGADPVVPATGQPTWRLAGLVVGGSSFAQRLGYAQREVHGPWLLEVLLRPLLARTRFVPWCQVQAITDSIIVIQARAEDLDDTQGVDRTT
ncbi:MAG: hypothetical protein M3285_00120 [Actinomycetota bacterium]|nr:hypothetical protein [Actinomycetota bacterium]